VDKFSDAIANRTFYWSFRAASSIDVGIGGRFSDKKYPGRSMEKIFRARSRGAGG
jgi:hypothetical protein